MDQDITQATENPISILNTISQTVNYRLIQTGGFSHKPSFLLLANYGEFLGYGIGGSIKVTKRNTANRILDCINDDDKEINIPAEYDFCFDPEWLEESEIESRRRNLIVVFTKCLSIGGWECGYVSQHVHCTISSKWIVRSGCTLEYELEVAVPIISMGGFQTVFKISR